jgi:hypothetical protein
MIAWWPAGAHLHLLLGQHYAVIGTGVGDSPDNALPQLESGNLEVHFAGEALLIPTHHGQGLPEAEIASLTTRQSSLKNPTYFPLDASSFTDFDYLVFFPSTAYARGGWPLPSPEQG